MTRQSSLGTSVSSLLGSDGWMLRLRLSPALSCWREKVVLRARGPGYIRVQCHPQLCHSYRTGALSAEDTHPLSNAAGQLLAPHTTARKKQLEKISWSPGQFRGCRRFHPGSVQALSHRHLKLLWTLPRPAGLLRGHAA